MPGGHPPRPLLPAPSLALLQLPWLLLAPRSLLLPLPLVAPLLLLVLRPARQGLQGLLAPA